MAASGLVKVKICGMTRVQDVESAVALGVDAIGVILHAKSPRLISSEQAKLLREAIPGSVKMVGVFVDCPAAQINKQTEQIGLDIIQLHGAESNAMANQLNKSYIKAIRARSRQQVTESILQYPQACAFLLDPYVKGQHGGTGKTLDKSLWPDNSQNKLVLAGGLNPHNLADAINQFKPYAVDLNSGLEVSPGKKSAQLMQQALSVIKHAQG